MTPNPDREIDVHLPRANERRLVRCLRRLAPRAWPALLAALVPVVLSGPIAAQTTDAMLMRQQLVLNIVWELAATPTDRMSSTDPAEARRLPMLGQRYYLPAAEIPGATRPFYRLLDPKGEHRSDVQPAGGQVVENVLGHVWRDGRQPPGTEPVRVSVNAASGEQGLAPGGTAPRGHAVSVLPDAHVWPRPGKEPRLLTLKGRQVRISSNLAAGGALWSLEWQGQQFIDQLDYGRLVQSSLSFSGPGASRALPTEGGDQTADADPDFMHGAPLLSAANTVSPQRAVQSTRAIPLEWRHTDFNGGMPGRAVAYPQWQLGKEITLDDLELPLAAEHAEWRHQVMHYTTVFVNGGPPLANADIEIPTAYLRAPFRRAFTCDATQKNVQLGLREISNAQYARLDDVTWHYQFETPAGGVILANDSLSHSLGIYASDPDQGGSARYFTLWRFGSVANPVVNKISAGAGPRLLSRGTNKFNSWIVVGRAYEVCLIMQHLHASGLR